MSPADRSDVRVIGTVGAAHLVSHLCQIAPTPLFLILRAEFDTSFAALGLAIALFYGASGLCQAPAGALVDKLGARRLLLGGLGLLAAGMALMAASASYPMFVAAAILAGVGNSVFHPSDLAILSARVSPARVGRAFALHAISGTLGYGVGAFMVGTLVAFVSWRVALLVVAAVALAAAAAVWAAGDRLETTAGAAHAKAGPAPRYLAVVGNATVFAAFCYFVLLAAAGTGVQGFGATALTQIYGVGIAAASAAATAYIVASATGIFLGGYIADRVTRHDLVAMGGLACAAATLFAVLTPGLGLIGAAAVLALAGLCSGLTGPSRDMLVRRIAPAGRAGRVFGFVYSGFDIGSAAIPLVCGALLDRHLPGAIFAGAAVLLLAGVATIPQVRSRGAAAAARA